VVFLEEAQIQAIVAAEIEGGYSSSSESYHTSKVTNYDPDKVKVAELENERVGLVKEAQLELMEFNAKMEAAMIAGAMSEAFRHHATSHDGDAKRSQCIG
jgi:hypothetical protein